MVLGSEGGLVELHAEGIQEGLEGIVMERMWEVLTCVEMMHRFSADGEGKSSGNCITHVCLVNGR